MSWVDLAALIIILWSVANGYLLGIRQMGFWFCGLVIALLAALTLQKPFSMYLSLEWQAERYFVWLVSRHVGELLNVGATGSFNLQLPSLAGTVMQRLAEESEVSAVFSQTAASQVVGEMIMRVSVVIFFFYTMAIAFSLILKVRYKQHKSKNIPELQRFFGMAIGLVCGLLLSLLSCLLLDTLSIFAASDFIEQDLSGSYLYLITYYFLQFIL